MVPVSDNNATAVTLYLDAAAGDPLVVPAAPLWYEGWFTLKASAAGVIFLCGDLRICAVPAYRAYARHEGVTTTLFRVSPAGGWAVFDLIEGFDTAQAGSGDAALRWLGFGVFGWFDGRDGGVFGWALRGAWWRLVFMLRSWRG